MIQFHGVTDFIAAGLVTPRRRTILARSWLFSQELRAAFRSLR